MVDDAAGPRRVGRYEVVETIEEGVTGTLFRARDTESGKSVLLKTVAPLVSQNPAFGRYFYDKWADRQSAVEHPNVLGLLDAGRDGDLYYVAVEDAGGARLSDLMDGTPLPLDDALDLVRQMAEGLRAVHRRDVVHGHLKPSDIVLSADQMGRTLVKVVCFDLGVSPSESMVSIFGEVMGTPKYMAPEAIRGRTPTPESDVFSLGVIAYELFTGREPFPSDHALGYLFSNCETEPPAADELQDDLPHEVALVVNRMLEKDPAQRYRSMQRVIDDLDRVAQSRKTGHVEVVPYGTDSAFARDYELPAPEPAARGGLRVSPATVVATLLVIVVVGALAFMAGQSRSQPPSGGDGPHVAVGPGRQVPPAPGRTPVPTGPAQPGNEREAREAFDRARAEWPRHREAGEFELALAEFEKVREDYPGTLAARQSLDELAKVYVEWAVRLRDKGEYEQAVQKYRSAVELTEDDTPFGRLARRNMPGAMLELAESLRTRGEFDRALTIYAELAERFPGTREAGIAHSREPDILYNQAFVLWKDDQSYDAALEKLLKVIRDYPETQWAGRARGEVPDLYLDAIREKIAEGALSEARDQLLKLEEAYPGHPAGAEAADMDAEILYNLFVQKAEDGAVADANMHYGELLRRYLNTGWAVLAVGRKLDLKRRPNDLFDANTARQRLEDAAAEVLRRDYTDAMQAVKGVLRYARADSEEAFEALAMLPEIMFDSATYAYGAGMKEQAKATLRDVGDQFPETEWERRADFLFESIADPPEAMTFVPAGPFLQGSSVREITALIRDNAPPGMAEDEEQIAMFAEVSGLLNETPRHTARTGAFFIDLTEVTNAQYKEFLDATQGPAPAHWEDGTYAEGEDELPVVKINLAEAQAYAEWRGCRLPTEGEWEKAARGTNGRRYPWGETFDKRMAHHMQPEPVGPCAVGLFPSYDSPYGCLDMIGNVREWTTTPMEAYEGTTWRGDTTPDSVVGKGGAWFQEEIAPIPARCASRYMLDRRLGNEATGFRCVKDAVPPEAGPVVADAE